MARKSTAAKLRHRKGQESGGSKRGNKGHFHGARAAFIAEQFPEFLIAQMGGRTPQKKFWDVFYACWWKKFHWRLPYGEDPTEDASYPDTDDDELEEKGKVVQETQLVSGLYSTTGVLD